IHSDYRPRAIALEALLEVGLGRLRECLSKLASEGTVSAIADRTGRTGLQVLVPRTEATKVRERIEADASRLGVTGELLISGPWPSFLSSPGVE
ncbi:MAG: hypothetical protein AAFX00_01130, partial [Pseudomonadota bacterium]